jgi:hypothetical protein
MTYTMPNPEVSLKTEDDEVCCGLILRQIDYEWTCCPFCGDDLPDWAMYSDVVLAKGGE